MLIFTYRPPPRPAPPATGHTRADQLTPAHMVRMHDRWNHVTDTLTLDGITRLLIGDARTILLDPATLIPTRGRGAP